jgi:hypothetical protein
LEEFTDGSDHTLGILVDGRDAPANPSLGSCGLYVNNLLSIKKKRPTVRTSQLAKEKSFRVYCL